MTATYAILGVALVCIILTFVSIIDASRREFPELYLRTLWVLVSAVPMLGFILWFTIGRSKSLPPGGAQEQEKEG